MDGCYGISTAFDLSAPKTKVLASALRPMLPMKKGDRKYDVILITGETGNQTIFRASSNLPKAKAIDALSLNIFDMMNHKNVFVEKSAIDVIEKHYK